MLKKIDLAKNGGVTGCLEPKAANTGYHISKEYSFFRQTFNFFNVKDSFSTLSKCEAETCIFFAGCP